MVATLAVPPLKGAGGCCFSFGLWAKIEMGNFLIDSCLPLIRSNKHADFYCFGYYFRIHSTTFKCEP